MNVRTYCSASALVFGLATIAHAIRLLKHWPLQVGPLVIAPEVSWIGLVVGAAMTIWGVRAARR